MASMGIALVSVTKHRLFSTVSDELTLFMFMLQFVVACEPALSQYTVSTRLVYTAQLDDVAESYLFLHVSTQPTSSVL